MKVYCQSPELEIRSRISQVYSGGSFERKPRRGTGSGLPSSAGGGVAARLRRSSEASFDGADGVVWSRNPLTTPPRLHELTRLRDFS